MIRNEPVFTLLDEQQVAFNAIMDEVRAAGQDRQKVAFLIQGGPGTGKSVIAVNLVASLSELGLRTLHVTGSKAFTENLRKLVGTRAGALFNYFRNPANVAEPFDVVDPRRGASDPRGQHQSLHARGRARASRRSTRSSTPGACRSSSSTICRSCARARSAAPT